MAELKEFKLPDVGEGLTEADIVSWHVKPGDQVEVNQVIVEIETAKAIVELPSPWDGTVTGLLVEEGQTVDVGIPIITIEDGQGSSQSSPEEPKAATHNDTGTPARTPVLVGYGVKPGSTARRPRKTGVTRPASYPSTPSAPPAFRPPAAAAPAPTTSPAPTASPVPATTPVPAEPPARALAKPPVRRLARDLGIDLTTITGTGPQ